MINLSLDLNGLESDVRLLLRHLKPAALSGISDATSMVQEGAIDVHRYKRKSGDLQRATQKKKVKDGYKAFLNLAKASYANRIHEGFGAWAPDEFLYKSFDRQQDKYIETVRRRIDKVIMRFNNG